MESEAQQSPSQCSRALELFLYFFKIGFYTFGGGWSIVAQIQQEYVQSKGWITDEDLLDITSVMWRAFPAPSPVCWGSPCPRSLF